MPTDYSGNGTVPSATKPWTQVAVTGVANTTPINVHAPAHGFNTGDTVRTQGTGVAAANILAQITKVDADHYLLNGTTASGTAGAGGYAVDMQVQPAVELPGAGEAVSAATSNVPDEAAQNVIPYLFERCGKYSLYNVYFANNSSFTSTNNTSESAFTLATNGDIMAFGSGIPPVTKDGDLFEITFTCAFWSLSANTSASVDASYAIGVDFAGGGYAAIPLSEYERTVADPANSHEGFSLTGWTLAGGDDLKFHFGLMYKLSVGLTTGNNEILGNMQMIAKHYRPST